MNQDDGVSSVTERERVDWRLGLTFANSSSCSAAMLDSGTLAKLSAADAMLAGGGAVGASVNVHGWC